MTHLFIDTLFSVAAERVVRAGDGSPRAAIVVHGVRITEVSDSNASDRANESLHVYIHPFVCVFIPGFIWEEV
jgi:hypothetical protein